MVTSTLVNTLKATAPPERVWRGSDFSQSSSWVTQIDSEVIADLTALAQTLPLPSEGLLDFDLTSKTTPRLNQFFQAVSRDLTAGKGFALLRGVPADDPELLRRVFCWWPVTWARLSCKMLEERCSAKCLTVTLVLNEA